MRGKKSNIEHGNGFPTVQYLLPACKIFFNVSSQYHVSKVSDRENDLWKPNSAENIKRQKN